MVKGTLVLILLLSLLSDSELKQPNNKELKDKASKAVKNLFGFSFSFSNTILEKEYTIHLDPKITAKLSSSCSTTFSSGSNSGYIQVKNGVVINQKGTKVDLSQKNIASIGKNLKIDFNKMTATLTSKLKSAVVDGTVSFSFSLTKITIKIVFSKSKGNNSCDGTLTLTITPNTKPKGSKPAVNAEAVEKAAKTAAGAGAVAVGAIILFKLAKGVAGFFAGGPVGALIGVAT